MSRILSPDTTVVYRVRVIETYFDDDGQLVTEDLYYGPFTTHSGAKRIVSSRKKRFDAIAKSVNNLLDKEARNPGTLTDWYRRHIDRHLHATISTTIEVSDPLVWN